MATQRGRGAEPSPASLGEESLSGDFPETQKPQVSPKGLDGTWAGKGVKGVPATGAAQGDDALSLLDAEGEPKTGLLRPLAALDLQRVFCP